MIDRLNILALGLYKFRRLLLLLAFLALLVLVLSLFDMARLSADQHLIPAIVTFCWSVTLYSVSSLFARVPGKPDRGAGWRQRFSIRIQRLFLSSLALLIAGLSLALILLSWQLVRTWLSA